MLNERRLLQTAVAVLSLVPVIAGSTGVLFGTGMTGSALADISTDSHVRYLSGLLLAIGLGFWSTVPAIERKTARVRLLTALVVVGGLARLYGVAVQGLPSAPMLFGLGMELVVTPLLCVWQARIAKAA